MGFKVSNLNVGFFPYNCEHNHQVLPIVFCSIPYILTSFWAVSLKESASRLIAKAEPARGRLNNNYYITGPAIETKTRDIELDVRKSWIHKDENENILKCVRDVIPKSSKLSCKRRSTKIQSCALRITEYNKCWKYL